MQDVLPLFSRNFVAHHCKTLAQDSKMATPTTT